MRQEGVEEVRRIAIDHHHDVASHFEQHYRDMEASRFGSAFTYGRQKVDRVLERELEALPAGASVLDVGCGTGAYLRRLSDRGFVPFGLEPAAAMRARAEESAPGAVVRDGVATDLPFEDGSFDAVIAIEVLRYLHRADNERALLEMYRVLKPGGRLFVTLVNRWALDGFYLLQRGRQLAKRRRFDRKNPHCEFSTPDAAKRDFEAAGFEDVRTIGRLLAPVRIAYKLNRALGERVARAVDPIDDLVSELALARPFAGHLIVIASRPERAATSRGDH